MRLLLVTNDYPPKPGGIQMYLQNFVDAYPDDVRVVVVTGRGRAFCTGADVGYLAGLLDELVVYMAPTLMGSRARPLLDLPLDLMSEQVPLVIRDARKVGPDWRFTAVPGA